jgi:hypothetical protein
VKWFQRGIIRSSDGTSPGDRVHLVGHSTGGNDIKRLMFYLCEAVAKNESFFEIPAKSICESLSSIQFLSTPHYGTTIAHHVRRLNLPIKTFVRGFYEVDRALRGSLTSGLAHGVTRLLHPSSLLRAVVQSGESFDARSTDPLDRAKARGNYFDALRWLHQISNDFGAIDDLDPYGTERPSNEDNALRAAIREVTKLEAVVQSVLAPPSPLAPMDIAQFDAEQGQSNLTRLRRPEVQQALADKYAEWKIDLRSIVTVAEPKAGSPAYDPFRVAHGITARPLPEPRTPYQLENREQLAKQHTLQTLESFVAGGTAKTVSIGPADNDGIVNSVSMVWPDPARSFLVPGDHGDIIGHYDDGVPDGVDGHTRYDLLRSAADFDRARFEMVWRSVRDFALESELHKS